MCVFYDESRPWTCPRICRSPTYSSDLNNNKDNNSPAKQNTINGSGDEEENGSGDEEENGSGDLDNNNDNNNPAKRNTISESNLLPVDKTHESGVNVGAIAGGASAAGGALIIIGVAMLIVKRYRTRRNRVRLSDPVSPDSSVVSDHGSGSHAMQVLRTNPSLDSSRESERGQEAFLSTAETGANSAPPMIVWDQSTYSVDSAVGSAIKTEIYEYADKGESREAMRGVGGGAGSGGADGLREGGRGGGGRGGGGGGDFAMRHNRKDERRQTLPQTSLGRKSIGMRNTGDEAEEVELGSSYMMVLERPDSAYDTVEAGSSYMMVLERPESTYDTVEAEEEISFGNTDA